MSDCFIGEWDLNKPWWTTSKFCRKNNMSMNRVLFQWEIKKPLEPNAYKRTTLENIWHTL